MIDVSVLLKNVVSVRNPLGTFVRDTSLAVIG